MSLSAKAGKIALTEVQRYESNKPKAQVSLGKAPAVETSWDDVEKISQLGTGSFSNVYKAKVRHPNLVDEIYALKCLKESQKEGSSLYKESHFVAGAVDLAIEAKILSELQHENIIRLVAVPTGCVSEAFAQKGGFFIVLELLEETLHDRLHKWRKSAPIMLATGTSPAAILERMESTVLGIASAMAHLHQNGIVLRDLKPDNVGFCASGTVKLFDFGLARPVDDVKGSSEYAGSLRYMAPETVLARGTSLASDVYSFGVLLWQICTLQQPFKKYAKISKFKEKVVLGKYRPSLKGLQSLQLSALIDKCWDFEPEERPTFAKILEELKTIVSGLSSYKKLPSSFRSQKLSPYRRSSSADSSNLKILKDASYSRASSTDLVAPDLDSSGAHTGRFGRMPIFMRAISLQKERSTPGDLDLDSSIGSTHSGRFGRMPIFMRAISLQKETSAPGDLDLDSSTGSTHNGRFGRRPIFRRAISLQVEMGAGERHCVGHNNIAETQEFIETEDVSGGSS
jgi:serine/threonine protein kinase